MRLQTFNLGAGCFFVSFMLSVPSSATNDRYISPSVCQPDGNNGANINLGNGVESLISGRIVTCPITSDSGFLINEATLATVSGINSSWTTYFQTCIGSSATGFASCSGPQFAPQGSYYALSLSITSWTYIGSQSPFILAAIGQLDEVRQIQVTK